MVTIALPERVTFEATGDLARHSREPTGPVAFGCVRRVMGVLEGEIAAAATMSVAGEDVGEHRLIKRIESLAVDHMKSLAVGASACVLLLSAALTFSGGPTSSSRATVDPTPVGSIETRERVPAAPEWQVVRKPVEIMALQAPQMERLTMQYVQRRTVRNDREDAIIWQATTPGGAEARIALVRGSSIGMPPSLFVEMTRTQAERGVAVTRAGAPDLLFTKFGSIEAADMTFSDASGGAQACIAFRGAGEGGGHVIAGWYCGAQGVAVERPEVACFIDRLALLKGGDDQTLRRLFAEAEQRRRPCPTTRNTAGRKPTWLDHDGRAPAMRGSDETTGSIGRPRR
jgi:hypothetical protein